MIYIIDNGVEYTGHTFYFVESSSEREIQLAVNRSKARSSYYSKMTIVAVATTIAWRRVARGSMTLERFIDEVEGRPLEQWERELNEVPEDADI